LDAQQFVTMGQSLYKQGDATAAIAHFNEAIRLDNQFPEAYISRGIVRRAKGETDGAIADYTAALKLDPKSVRAYINRGISRNAKGDKEGAIQDYSEAIKLDPINSVAFNNRGYARVELGDFTGAIADCSQAIQLNPKQSFFYHSRAMAYAGIGDYGRARADFQQSLALKPDHPKAQFMKDKIAEWTGIPPLATDPGAGATASAASAAAATASMPGIPGAATGKGAKRDWRNIPPADALPNIPAEKAGPQPSLLFGIIGGAVGAAVGAVIWGLFTAITKWEIGWIAIAIGALTGLGVRTFGNGHDPRFGAAGAILAGLGCFAGNVLAVYFMAVSLRPDLAGRILQHIDILIRVMGDNMNVIDGLFYLIAIYEGFKFAMRPVRTR